MIATRLTEMLGLQYPIVLAPMGSVSGRYLAATVSNAGDLPADALTPVTNR
jgi:NAD(P)H-dependent flavin oxidoreductase YrpB (nitropropane dioxygenase family)